MSNKADDPMKHSPSNTDGEFDRVVIQPRYCNKCAEYVTPVGKGRCPVHGLFLHLNFEARLHPVNVARVEVILAGILAKFPPDDIIERSRSELLASVIERAKATKPGSVEFQRLIATEQMLTVSLQVAKDAKQPPPPEHTVLSQAALRAQWQLLGQMISNLDSEPEPQADELVIQPDGSVIL